MEVINFTPGPIRKDQIYFYQGQHFQAKKAIKKASAAPKAGAYYELITEENQTARIKAHLGGIKASLELLQLIAA